MKVDVVWHRVASSLRIKFAGTRTMFAMLNTLPFRKFRGIATSQTDIGITLYKDLTILLVLLPGTP
jgi:hypothetical protein